MRPSENLSNHILPTASTMVGVCMTVISIVRLSHRPGVSHYIDEALAVDGVIFLVSVLCSYLSIRYPSVGRRLESFADNAFVVGLIVMAVSGLVLAFELM